MRTTLDIDEGLLEDVLSETAEKSKSRAVNKALEEYLRHLRTQRLLGLQGRLDLDLDDWYEVRHMER